MLPAPVEIRFTPKAVLRIPIQFGEPNLQHDLLVHRGRRDLQVVDDALAEWSHESDGALGDIFSRGLAGERKRIFGGLNLDVFVRERFFKQPSQRLQVLFDIDAIDGSLPGAGPDDDSGGALRPFAFSSTSRVLTATASTIAGSLVEICRMSAG